MPIEVNFLSPGAPLALSGTTAQASWESLRPCLEAAVAKQPRETLRGLVVTDAGVRFYFDVERAEE